MNKIIKQIAMIFTFAILIAAAAPAQASAQQCAWTLYVNGSEYSSSASYATSGKLTYSGSTVTLNNFSGSSIEAVPGGFYGDDDAPVLNIVVKGTNTLSGGLLTDDSFGALYSETRAGGYGEDSIINISGTGTLKLQHLDYDQSFSSNADYNAILAGKVNLSGSVTLDIDYRTGGCTSDHHLRGIDASALNLSGSSILKIKLDTIDGYPSPYSQQFRKSGNSVCGVSGTITNGSSGYCSIDTAVTSNTSSDICCTGKSVTLSTSSSAFYAKTVPGRSLPAVTTNGQQKYLANISNLSYAAYTPITASSTLESISSEYLAKTVYFAKAGEPLPYGDAASSDYLNKGFYYTRHVLDIDRETGQYARLADFFESDINGSCIFENEIQIYPAPGYHFVEGANNLQTIKSWVRNNYNDFMPDNGYFNCNRGSLYISYMYVPVIFTKQPPVAYCSKSTVDIRVGVKPVLFEEFYDEAVTYEPDFSFQWYVRVTKNGSYADVTLDSLGITGNLPQIIPDFNSTFLNKTVNVNSNSVKLSDADRLQAYCRVATIAESRNSSMVELVPSGHAYKAVGAREATCTEKGYTGDYECEACGTITAGSEIAPKGHTPVEDPAIEATYQKTGLTAGSHCSTCGKVLTAQKVVAKKKLSAPVISSVTCSTDKGLIVKWKKVTGATGYKIYRKTGTGSWKSVKSITSGSTVSWSDTAANTNGTKYQYKVYAYAGSYDNNHSSASSIKTAYRLSRPSITSAKNSASKKITVKWSKNSKAKGYEIKYVTGSTTKTATVKIYKTLSKTLKSLKKGKTYKIYVRSYKTASSVKYYSAWSSYKSVKVKK